MNKLEIMKLQTYKMFEGEDTVYVRRDDILELLEQEPTDDATLKDIFCMGCEYKEPEPCEDAISRQAVQDYIAKCLSQYLYNDVREAVEEIDEYIGELPPVQPKRQGHREYNDIYDHYLCGNCKTVVADYDNFCPNCGARMAESEE